MQIDITIPFPPVTKKNHPQIITKKSGGKSVPVLLPSKQYVAYEKKCLEHLAGVTRKQTAPIDYPVNVKAIYYMQTHRIVDRTNLDQALHDILVRASILKDDNSRIIAGTDGSRVRYDKEYPRTEVTITTMEAVDE